MIVIDDHNLEQVYCGKKFHYAPLDTESKEKGYK